MDIIIVAVIAGAIGGTIAAKILPNFSLGTLFNSIAGIVGGGLGTKILTMLGVGSLVSAVGGGLTLNSVVASMLTGIVGGAVLLIIFGLIRNLLRR